MTPDTAVLGSSQAARFLDDETHRARRWIQSSASVGIESAQQELASVWEECSDDDWDGQGAVAIEPETFYRAGSVLASLPLGTPPPSVGAEPDGSITLEWHRSSRRVLSVSVGADGDLHFAALLGPNRLYGTEVFFGEMPESIRALIARISPA